jgi:hypothetical protein
MESNIDTELARFRAMPWKGCRYTLERASPDEWRLMLERPARWFRGPQRFTVTFVRPREEWTALWNRASKQWIDHPDPAHPLGPRIEAAAIKGVATLLVSFGGHHARGWARWGFQADAVRFEP